MTDFTEQDLSDSRFEKVHLQRATFHDVSLVGASFTDVDLSGVRIHAAWLDKVRMTGVEIPDLEISGEVGRLVVNGVEVGPLVEAELDRRHPERAAMRPTTADGFREAFAILDRLWGETLDRARVLPPEQLHEQVDGEWSLVQTQRHLLFAGDAWLGNAVLEEEAPYHPLGFPHGGMPPEESAALGLTLEATPTLDEVLAPRLARMATMRRVVDGLTEAELDRVCGRRPADPYPDQEYVVRRCLRVVLKEEAEHHRYAVRDLAVLEAGA